jgi:hypothetical protein
LPDELLERAREHAEREHRSLSGQIAYWVDQHAPHANETMGESPEEEQP